MSVDTDDPSEGLEVPGAPTEARNTAAGTDRQLAVLIAAVRVQLRSINKKRARAKCFFTRLTVAQLAVLAATPVVLGLGNMQGFDAYTTVALILSGLSFLIGGLIAAFSFRERWMSFAAVSGALQGLMTDGRLMQVSGSSVSASEISEFNARFQAALANGNSDWKDAVTESA